MLFASRKLSYITLRMLSIRQAPADRIVTLSLVLMHQIAVLFDSVILCEVTGPLFAAIVTLSLVIMHQCLCFFIPSYCVRLLDPSLSHSYFKPCDNASMVVRFDSIILRLLNSSLHPGSYMCLVTWLYSTLKSRQ